MIQNLYVAFYKGRGKTWLIRFGQWLTRIISGGPYSHCEIIHQTWEAGKDPFKDEAIEIWYGATTHDPKGVAKRKLKVNYDNWVIYRVTHGVDIDKAVKFLDNRVGLKYDWMGIILCHLIPLGFDKTHKYFCSEYLAECFLKSIKTNVADVDNLFGAPATIDPTEVETILKSLDIIKPMRTS